jgi:hypothetical protein
VQCTALASIGTSSWLIPGQQYQITISACGGDPLFVNAESIESGSLYVVWSNDCQPYTFTFYQDMNINCTISLAFAQCLGDYNGDHFYGIEDLLYMISSIGVTGNQLIMDMNQDGMITIQDMMIFQGLFNQNCTN